MLKEEDTHGARRSERRHSGLSVVVCHLTLFVCFLFTARHLSIKLASTDHWPASVTVNANRVREHCLL